LSAEAVPPTPAIAGEDFLAGIFSERFAKSIVAKMKDRV
jgi:hypothetical protein